MRNQGRWTGIIVGVFVGVLFSAAAVPAGILDPNVGPPVEGQQLQGVGAGPIGTGFSYQGLLKKGGSPFTGNCDMQFKLYDASSGGNLLGTIPAQPSPVTVTNGLFTTYLDFGDQFKGDDRYLEPLVSCPAGASPSYQSLGIQAVFPAPYALSLRPGAIIRGTPPAGYPALWVINTSSMFLDASIFGDSRYGDGVVGQSGADNGLGAGVWGASFSPTGVGVRALGGSGGGGAALMVERGGIKVLNAGIGTNTPVFIHKVNTAPGGNLCAIQNYSTVLDNALINGVPGAMLIVTPNYGPKSTGTAPAVGIPAVYYDSLNECGKGAGRWVIYNLDAQSQTHNSLFNVMAVVP